MLAGDILRLAGSRIPVRELIMRSAGCREKLLCGTDGWWRMWVDSPRGLTQPGWGSSRVDEIDRGCVPWNG
jgi:hypothetical protein